MIKVLSNAFFITSFVFTMMLLIEWLNVLTRGSWQGYLTKHRWGQYLVASFLGITPGCLGAFAVVTMYTHNIITIGAVVTAMIATSGDEAFVIFALIPRQAFVLNSLLFVLGISAGFLTDSVWDRVVYPQTLKIKGFELHEDDMCVCFPFGKLKEQWKNCSSSRGILSVLLVGIIMAIVFGYLGDDEGIWIKVTILMTSLIALFIVATVPDHFLEEHLWKHVVLKHVPRVFLWTFGVLFVLYFLINHLKLDLEGIISESKWIVLFIAAIIGLIPESGPHFVFITLYSRGLIPFSILLTSSIVQDGHGMLPLLAHSRRSFLIVKGINFLTGIVIGSIAMGFGY